MILSARDFALCRNVAVSVVEETEIDNDFFIYLSYAVMSNAKNPFLFSVVTRSLSLT